MPAKEPPTAARYFYFHVENSEEIKRLWKTLGERSGVEVKPEDTSKIVKEAFQSHGTTRIAGARGRDVELSILLYRNIVILSAFFYSSEGYRKLQERVAQKELPGTDVSIGGATVRIVKGKEAASEIKEVGRGYGQIETALGQLYQFEEEPGHKDHLYLLQLKARPEELEHFLTLHFPVFDFSIHKLHMERDYFRNQRKWIVKEKAEIDKTIGDILHKRIVGETLNPQFIEALEKEIDILSTKYAILVNDGHLIRKARTVLERDTLEVHRNLEGFGRSPEGGLSILRETEGLIKTLKEDETSISYAIKNTKTAIDTVRTNVDLLRSRENILLQEKGVSYQVAAAVLEFIIIFYYSIASWEHLIGAHRMELIPPTLRFISIFLFTTLAVVLTHYVGESYREGWKLNNGMIITGALLLAAFIYITYLSIQTGRLPVEVAH
ncbi:MAG: hypothetical protein D6733_02320 [Methanobacteriota archaeon]|nr:MAG: hypothetical protein D6733_02320 [Euryarchaeota archaeon]